MREIGDDVRRARQKRLLARGASSEYQDLAVYERVERALNRALAARESGVLLLPELFEDAADVRLTEQLRVTSHRPLLGPLIVFVKRRIILPLTRTLFEYCQDNFRRQQQVNEVLMACIEELALENALLEKQARGETRG
jgi:hypothetical protein